jgi:hypothetical protein
MQLQTISRADYTVQVGAFKDQARAARFVEELEQQGFPAAAYINETDSKSLTRIRVGPYQDRTTAEHMRKQLDAMHIPGFLVPVPSSPDVTSAGTSELQAMTSSNEAAIQDTKSNKARGSSSDPASIQAGNWRGYVELEGTAFFEDPAFSGQSNSNLSIAAEPEYIKEWNRGNDIFTFKPFYRIDQRDENRTHGDLRELSWIHAANDWEVLSGVGKVFWGV